MSVYIEGREPTAAERLMYLGDLPGAKLLVDRRDPFCIAKVGLEQARGFAAYGVNIAVTLGRRPQVAGDTLLARAFAAAYADKFNLPVEVHNPSRAVGRRAKCIDHNPNSKSYEQAKFLVLDTWSFSILLPKLCEQHPDLFGVSPNGVCQRWHPWYSRDARIELGILTHQISR